MDQKIGFRGLDKSLRKQKIIDTATNVFHRKGYRSATLDDVATELGLTKAALYHYVSSKEDLLSIIYLQALESFFAKAYEIGKLDLPPREKLQALIRHHIKHVVIDNLAMFAVFFSEENQLPEKDFQRIRAEKEKYTRVVEGILEEGTARGDFRPADTWLQACAILGMCNWLYKWYKPGASPQTPDEIADSFIDLLEDGYLIKPRDPHAIEDYRDKASKTIPLTRKKELVLQLRRQSETLTNLIAELAKTV
jgi:AcrR family transcriptional regulator